MQSTAKNNGNIEGKEVLARPLATLMKKVLGQTQTLALAVVRRSQNFLPATDPHPRGTGRPKFNQLDMVTTFTYKPSLVKIDARKFRVIVVTDPPTNTARPPQTGPITIHCAAKLSAQCN